MFRWSLAIIASVSLFAVTSAESAVPVNCVPTVESLTPLSDLAAEFPASVRPTGLVGTNLSLQGDCLSSTGALAVGGEPAELLEWSNTRITFHISPNVQPGEHFVYIRTVEGKALEYPFAIEKYSLPMEDETIVPGSIDVRVAPGTNVPELSREHGGGWPQLHYPDIPEEDPLGRWWSIPVESGAEITKMVELAEDQRIERAKPVLLGRGSVAAEPDDFYFTPSFQWGLYKVGAPAAWDRSTGQPWIEIGIVDSGVGTHADLNAHKVSEQDFTGQGLGDICDHGTAVAGVAAADTDNGIYIAGMGWNTKFRSYKVLHQENCAVLPTSNAALRNALSQAVNDGVRVLNMSLQNYSFDFEVQDAINRAWASGVFLAGAAGNHGSQTPQYPGNYAHVMTVAASTNTSTDERRTDSNFGSWVEVAAPGDMILATSTTGIGLANKSGTSMAAPLVAGTAALLMAYGRDNCEVWTAITRTAVPRSYVAYGRLDAAAAMTIPKACNDEDQTQPLDLDADGDTDLVHICCDTFVHVWRSDGAGFFAVTQFSPGGGYNVRQGAWLPGDFNGDGRSDLAHVCCTNYLHVWQSNGNGTFDIKPAFQPGPGYSMFNGTWQAGDFNGDGKTDLLHLCCSNYAWIWLSLGNGSFSGVQFYPQGGAYSIDSGSFRVGYFNDDNRADLAHLCCPNHFVMWLANSGGTSFNVQSVVPGGGYAVQSGTWRVGKFDSGSRDDLIHICCSSYAEVWLTNASGYSFNRVIENAGYSQLQKGRLFILDFNSDGRDDLFHPCCLTHGFSWQSNGNGTFNNVQVQGWAGYNMEQGLWRVGHFAGAGPSGWEDIFHICCTEFGHMWIHAYAGQFGVGGPITAWPGYNVQVGRWR